MQRSPSVAVQAALGELNERLRSLALSGETIGVGLFLIEIEKLFAPALTAEQTEEVAWVLSRVLRQGDVVAPVEGSTFAVLITGLTDREDARVVADRTFDALPETWGPWVVRFGLGFLETGAEAVSRAWSTALGELEDKRLSSVARQGHRQTLRVRRSQ